MKLRKKIEKYQRFLCELGYRGFIKIVGKDLAEVFLKVGEKKIKNLLKGCIHDCGSYDIQDITILLSDIPEYFSVLFSGKKVLLDNTIKILVETRYIDDEQLQEEIKKVKSSPDYFSYILVEFLYQRGFFARFTQSEVKESIFNEKNLKKFVSIINDKELQSIINTNVFDSYDEVTLINIFLMNDEILPTTKKYFVENYINKNKPEYDNFMSLFYGLEKERLADYVYTLTRLSYDINTDMRLKMTVKKGEIGPNTQEDKIRLYSYMKNYIINKLKQTLTKNMSSSLYQKILSIIQDLDNLEYTENISYELWEDIIFNILSKGDPSLSSMITKEQEEIRRNSIS